MNWKKYLFVFSGILFIFLTLLTIKDIVAWNTPYAVYDYQYSKDNINFISLNENSYWNDSAENNDFYFSFKVNGSKYNKFDIRVDDSILDILVNGNSIYNSNDSFECKDCGSNIITFPLHKNNIILVKGHNIYHNEWIYVKNITDINYFPFFMVLFTILSGFLCLIFFLSLISSKKNVFVFGILFIFLLVLLSLFSILFLSRGIKYLFSSKIINTEFSYDGVNYFTPDWAINEGFKINDSEVNESGNTYFYKFTIKKGLTNTYYIVPDDCLDKFLINGEEILLDKNLCHDDFNIDDFPKLELNKSISVIDISVKSYHDWTSLNFVLVKINKYEFILLIKCLIILLGSLIIFYFLKYSIMQRYRKKNFFWNLFH